MATHSSVLAWRIPGTGEPGGLPSMGSHRVGHDGSDLAAAAAAASWFGHFNSLKMSSKGREKKENTVLAYSFTDTVQLFKKNPHLKKNLIKTSALKD